MALLGREKCEAMVKRLTAAAKEALSDAFDDTAFLCDLADSLAVRRN